MTTTPTDYIGNGKIYTISRIVAAPTITSTIADSEGTTDYIECWFERTRPTDIYLDDLFLDTIIQEHWNIMARLNRERWFSELYGKPPKINDHTVMPILNRKLMDHRVLGKKNRRS